MAKIFLSFLGTNSYVKCNYFYKEEKIKNISFIQEGIYRIFCKDFDENDKIIIFLTQSARERNWVDSEINNNCGLERTLKKITNKINIQVVDIPNGNSEEEIWIIFEKIFNSINEKDEIILDITHGFRSLPMLNMTLLNYAKF